MADQDMANKKAERNKRNRSGKSTDLQAAKKRGDEGVGGRSKSAQTKRLRRKMEKNGTKFKKGEDAGHKKSLKSGGSNSASNGRKESSSSNRSKGGQMGNKRGKAAGGRKSSRKGIKNK